VDALESTADDIEGLLTEVLQYQPDTVLLDESSPLSAASCLLHLLSTLPGKSVVLVSQERNQMHVIHLRTIEMETASDLFETSRLA